MKVALSNYDKAWRCPVWSWRWPQGDCDGGSFAKRWGDYKHPKLVPMRCETCGTWRLPTFGIRLFFHRIEWRRRMRRWEREGR